jgi:hypothetical protein
MDIDYTDFANLPQEPLDPALEPYIEESIWTVLKHPLVFAVPYIPRLNAFYNKQYSFKLEAVYKAISEKNWSRFLYLHERPYRIHKFAEVHEQLSGKDYWESLGSIWVDSENIFQNLPLWRVVLNSNRPQKHMLMDEDEREFLANLPDEFLVYRGYLPRKNKNGYSWTLSHFKANWFAKRFDQLGQVASQICKKEDVIACFLGRSEYEIVTAPKNPKAVRKLIRPKWLEDVSSLCRKQFTLPNSYHGPQHWEKVERNAIAIAELSDADMKVVRLFSVIHDSKRINENDDPLHGHRSAELAQNLYDQGLLPINKEQLTLLMDACKYHNDGQTTDNKTIGTCWDADRLDLLRVNIVPDKKYLSTEAAKNLMWKI